MLNPPVARSGKITLDVSGYLTDIIRGINWIDPDDYKLKQRFYRIWYVAEVVSPKELKKLRKRPDFWERRLIERRYENENF